MTFNQVWDDVVNTGLVPVDVTNFLIATAQHTIGPEPTPAALLGIGLLGLTVARRRGRA